MSRKGLIVFMSGWLVSLTVVLFVGEMRDVQWSAGAQAAMFLLATGPIGVSLLLVRRASPARSVTQILYDLEHTAAPAGRVGR